MLSISLWTAFTLFWDLITIQYLWIPNCKHWKYNQNRSWTHLWRQECPLVLWRCTVYWGAHQNFSPHSGGVEWTRLYASSQLELKITYLYLYLQLKKYQSFAFSCMLLLYYLMILFWLQRLYNYDTDVWPINPSLISEQPVWYYSRLKNKYLQACSNKDKVKIIQKLSFTYTDQPVSH